MNICYLFDFDGTLVDSMPTFVSAMLRILDESRIHYDNGIIKIITPLGLNGTAEYYINQLGVKMSKEQQKYSSVDGQGASQQKMTMIIMTGMFAIFSFMYSSAFSIYMITSNVLSLVSTLVINKLVDVVAQKKEEKALLDKYNKRFAYRTGSATKTDEKNKKSK